MRWPCTQWRQLFGKTQELAKEEVAEIQESRHVDKIAKLGFLKEIYPSEKAKVFTTSAYQDSAQHLREFEYQVLNDDKRSNSNSSHK